MMNSLPWAHVPTESELRRATRRGAAMLLRWASASLARAAQQLASAEHDDFVSRTPVLEFHAEAGALEGALYVDGRLVGHLSGVTRL